VAGSRYNEVQMAHLDSERSGHWSAADYSASGKGKR